MSDIIVEKYEHSGLKVEIVVDQDGGDFNDPRQWENFGTMVCWHPDYILGDEQIHRSEAADALDEAIEKWDVVLPLFLMDHSGISMSTSSAMFKAFDSVGWDWGQVGFIFGSSDTTPNEEIEKYLRQEVETYDCYLRGEVYGYIIRDTDGENLDSCWGFVGDIDYVKLEANNAAEWQASAKKKEQREVYDWACRDVVTV